MTTIVTDPSFSGTEIETHLLAAAERHGIALAHHTGSVLDVDDVPCDLRGPTMPALARRIAGGSGSIDAATIGAAARSLGYGEMRAGGDPPVSGAQQRKYLWHLVLALGRDS